MYHRGYIPAFAGASAGAVSPALKTKYAPSGGSAVFGTAFRQGIHKECAEELHGLASAALIQLT
jgi:hypothetical protein